MWCDDGLPCTTTVVELLMPSSGSLLVKEHVYTPPPPLPTLVTMRVLLTTPSCVTLVIVTATFCGKVQEGIRVGDGEEATQLRERFVFSMTLVTLPRETIKDGPGEKKSPNMNKKAIFGMPFVVIMGVV